jgi:hypothetical protein
MGKCSLIFLFAFLCTETLHAKSGRVSCNQRERLRRSCALQMGPLKVSLSPDRWHFDDNIKVGAFDLPLKGEGVDWEKVTLQSLGGRRFLQLWFWSTPQGEPGLETLTWFVIEISGLEAPERLQQVVRRRRKVLGTTLAKLDSVTSAKIQYQYDPIEKHSLQPHGSRIRWAAGRQKGEF